MFFKTRMTIEAKTKFLGLPISPGESLPEGFKFRAHLNGASSEEWVVRDCNTIQSEIGGPNGVVRILSKDKINRKQVELEEGNPVVVRLNSIAENVRIGSLRLPHVVSTNIHWKP